MRPKLLAIHHEFSAYKLKHRAKRQVEEPHLYDVYRECIEKLVSDEHCVFTGILWYIVDGVMPIEFPTSFLRRQLQFVVLN
jgi:hypothetical protein